MIYNVDRDDLAQEGMVVLFEVIETLDKTRTEAEGDAFLKQQIRWGMLAYVAGNFCDVRMNKKQFFEGKRYSNETLDHDEMFVDISKSNPEDLYILLESKARTHRCLAKFKDTITDANEAFVWENIIHTDDPISTRQAALEIGVRSNKTVANIKKRLLDRFSGFYKGSEEVGDV